VLWANTSKYAVKKLDDIHTIIEEVKTAETNKKYFNPTWDASRSLSLATSNGPFGTMTIVQSNNYPVAARVIKDLFQLTPQTVANPGAFAQGNVMLQLPGEIDKESEAKKGIIKLMLLQVHGNIDIDSTLVTNNNPSSPSRGMQVVSNKLHAVHAGQFADLVQMTKEQGNTTSVHCKCLFESCQKYLHLICFKETLQRKKLPALSLRQIQSSHLPFYLRKILAL
jgi:hypothetical protein